MPQICHLEKSKLQFLSFASLPKSAIITFHLYLIVIVSYIELSKDSFLIPLCVFFVLVFVLQFGLLVLFCLHFQLMTF